MRKSESWKSLVIIFGLLVFAGLASAAWLWLSSREDTGGEQQEVQLETELETVTVDVGDYVLGSDLLQVPFIKDNVDGLQFSQWVVIGAAVGLVVVSVGALGLLLAVVTWFFGRRVTKVYEDEEFQAAQSELQQREAARLQGLREQRPTAQPAEPEQTGRWSVVSTSIVIVMFVWITGVILGVAYFGETTWEIAGRQVNAASVITLILVLLTIAILILVIRRQNITDFDSGETDYKPVNWSTIWILLSGVIIVGIGAGLAIAMRSVAPG